MSDTPTVNTPRDTSICPLGPIDPASIPEAEQEKSAPWVVRKLAGSMTGRIVMSSYETMKAAGTSVLCLSPWGDSSPFLLPCVRFRDLVVHMVIAGTGGVAAVAAPVMYPISDAVISTVGDSILVEIGMTTGFDLTTKLADDLVIGHPIKHMIPVHSKRLETTGVKSMLITLQYKHLMGDAAIGFYRSSLHEDTSLFATVKDYLAIEKGWFSPYLFASGRRPVIPRAMKPDIIFCHGPFLSGDYAIGQTMLQESALVISFANEPAKHEDGNGTVTVTDSSQEKADHHSRLSLSTYTDKLSSFSSQIPLLHSRSRSPSPNPSSTSVQSDRNTPSPPPKLAPLPPPSQPRRLVVTVVGLKPHRAGLWTSSQRPAESVMYYQLLNGCPAVVVPVRLGAPLVAWDGMTLKELWKVEVPDEEESGVERKVAKEKDEQLRSFDGIVGVLFEFLDICVEWERVALPKDSEGGVEAPADGDTAATSQAEGSLDEKKRALRDALKLLVAGAVSSGKSKKVRKEVDEDRAGIVMWRIP